MDRLVGTEVCISSPGSKYVYPTSQVFAPSQATTPAPIPTNVADGTNTYCGQYYMALQGDYCNMILVKYSISLADFVFLNPAINEK